MKPQMESAFNAKLSQSRILRLKRFQAHFHVDEERRLVPHFHSITQPGDDAKRGTTRARVHTRNGQPLERQRRECVSQRCGLTRGHVARNAGRRVGRRETCAPASPSHGLLSLHNHASGWLCRKRRRAQLLPRPRMRCAREAARCCDLGASRRDVRSANDAEAAQPEPRRARE